MRVILAVLLGVLATHVTSAFLFPVSSSRVPGRVSRLGAYDVQVTLPDGSEVRTVKAEEGQNLLDAFEAHDIDAPHSCRSGLCTE